MDAVYICRAGDNEELRYSLRSLANLAHDDVWVFGGRPPWYTGRYVPVPQTGSKQDNAKRALAAACAHPEVSDRFILMNDDFFVTAPTALQLFDRGRIVDVLDVQMARHGMSSYTRAMRRTIDVLRGLGHDDPLSYELHVPMPVDKRVMADALDVIRRSGDVGLQHRSIYGALAGEPSVTMADVKVERVDEPPPPPPWLSSNDATFRVLRPLLAWLFPERGEHEKEEWMVKVRALKRFRDRQARCVRQVDEVFEVTSERAAELNATKYGKLVAIVATLDPDPGPAPAPPVTVEHDMKVADIKAILDARGIEYRRGAKKAELLELLG